MRRAGDIAARREHRNLLHKTFNAWCTSMYRSVVQAAESSACLGAVESDRLLLRDAFMRWHTHSQHMQRLQVLQNK